MASLDENYQNTIIIPLLFFHFFRRHSLERADRAAALQMVVIQPHFLFFGGMTLFSDQVHFLLQPQYGKLPVAGLGPFLACGGFQPCGQMNDPNGGIGLVHMLSARTGRTAGFDFQVGCTDSSGMIRLKIKE